MGGIMRRGALAGLLVCFATNAIAGAAQPAGLSGTDLYRRKLYKDAAEAFLREIKGRPEADCGKEFLYLGESFYNLGLYAKARPYFVKAKQHAPEPGDEVVADYRLACVAYRMGDAAGALEMTDAFVRKHSSGRRAGTLLLFKMKLLAKRGKEAQQELEAVYAQLRGNDRTVRSAIGMAADKILTDFYVQHGQEAKAKERYVNIVHGFRNVIAQCAKEKRPVPDGLRQAHDDAAMQLGIIALKTRQFDDAVKWLENVKYDAELKREARLRLAQVAYGRRDFDRAVHYLTQDGFIDTVPPGALRSDMYLVLGLSEKNKANPNLGKVVEYLPKVDRGTEGYCQAQLNLGEIYRERGLVDRAVAAYENAAPSPKFEVEALFYLGTLCVEAAGQAREKTAQDALYRKAAERLSQLTTKYPSSKWAKQAGEAVDTLLGKGYKVVVAMSDEEMVRRWEETARTKPGSVEAARSLINMARLHHKAVLDEKTKRFVKAPNFAACAAVCERLLDGKVYAGKGFPPEQWRDLRVDALYFRAVSHLASVSPDKALAGGAVPPTYIRKPDLEGAIRDFTEAKDLVDPKRLDLVKSVELGLLEALFKSDNKEQQERAQARFAELVNEYGTDVRFQKLAMDLAEWYHSQERYAEAAREYKGIADRGANLPREDVLKALFMAGRLYGKAAYDARHAPGERKYGITICPKEVLQLADLLKTHKPFQKKIRVKWPEKAKDITAEEALEIVSAASDIPFVWATERRYDAVAGYLKRHRVRFQSLQGTVEEFLRQILDLKVHRLALDIGITGGVPTIDPKPRDPDDPETAGTPQTIEVYDERRRHQRFAPLARDYGSWRQAHNGRAMMFHVIERIESLSQTKVLWAEGVEKGDVLAAEFEQIPGLDPNQGCSCAEALARLLEPLDLRYTIVPRDRSAELYDAAKNCFNEIRQIDPKSPFGERSLFLLALNFYHQEDYERMKIILKEYLKVFDSPSHEHYHQACFWVGWVFEHERRYRDACRYYSRGAEEGLVVYKPQPDEKRPSRDEIKAQLSYETRFALEEPVSGALKDSPLATKFLDFIRMSSNVAIRLDASAIDTEATIQREPFTKVPVLDLLCDALDPLGLAVRMENINKEVAEKAYYRLASAYKKDGLMEQALAACNVLLARFPDTGRRRDAYKLRLEIYKGLKDYRNVLATLERMKTELKGEIEPHKIDFEMAWIYFDLCRYQEAVEHFKKSLAAAKDPAERTNIRDGYARALFRLGDLPEALSQYRMLAKDETEPLRAFVHQQMLWYLELATTKSVLTALPSEASALIKRYEALTDDQRTQLPKSTLAKVTWIYYVAALVDLDQGKSGPALAKLNAAGNSPDDWLAADAIYRTGMLHMKAKEYKKAREAFEYLLFSTKSAEAEVKATFALGLCLTALGEAESARKRFEVILRRFPDSVYAGRIRAGREAEPEGEDAQPKKQEPPPKAAPADPQGTRDREPPPAEKNE